MLECLSHLACFPDTLFHVGPDLNAQLYKIYGPDIFWQEKAKPWNEDKEIASQRVAADYASLV